MTLLLVLAAAAMLSVQYHRRSRVHAVATGVAGVCLAVLAGVYGPWPLLAATRAAPRPDGGSSVRLAADPARVGWTEWSWSNRPSWILIQAPIRLVDLEPGWSGSVQAVQGTLQVTDGPTIHSPGPTSASEGIVDGDEDPTRGVVARLLDVREVVQPRPPSAPAVTLLAMHQHDLDRAAGRDARYRGRMRVSLTKRTIEAVLPLSAGSAHQDGAWRFHVDEIDRTSARLIIRARTSNAVSIN